MGQLICTLCISNTSDSVQIRFTFHKDRICTFATTYCWALRGRAPPAFVPQRIKAADPLPVTQSNLDHLGLKFCRTLGTGIPLSGWTLIQSLCLTSLSELGKKGGK